MSAYMDARLSDEVVEIDIKWLMQNMHKLVDKKVDVPDFCSIFYRYFLGKFEIFISDPAIADDILKDNSIVDKESGVG